MMRNKHMIRTLAVLLAVMLCMTAFSTVAFASDREAATTSEAQTEPTDSADITGDDLSKLSPRCLALCWAARRNPVRPAPSPRMEAS